MIISIPRVPNLNYIPWSVCWRLIRCKCMWVVCKGYTGGVSPGKGGREGGREGRGGELLWYLDEKERGTWRWNGNRNSNLERAYERSSCATVCTVLYLLSISNLKIEIFVNVSFVIGYRIGYQRNENFLAIRAEQVAVDICIYMYVWCIDFQFRSLKWVLEDLLFR